MNQHRRLLLSTFLSISIVISMLVSVSSCGILEYLEDYDITIPEIFEPTPVPDPPLVTQHTFSIPGTHTVRGGYISGTTTPSVSLNLAEVFDLQALVDKNYSCNIYVSYYCKVNGDHLNVRCSLSGPSNEKTEYVYLDHNESSSLSLSAYNIPASSFSDKSILYIKWDCKGITAFDGLNECQVSDVNVSLTFTQN